MIAKKHIAQRSVAATTNKRGRRSQAASQNTANGMFPVTRRQRSLGQQYLNYPGDITLGERWEALRRLLLKELPFYAGFLDLGREADRCLERAVSDAMVRGYALGMAHSAEGGKLKAPTLFPSPPGRDAEGNPTDRRQCELMAGVLHQFLRQAMPACNGSHIIGMVRKQLEKARAEHQAAAKTKSS